MMTDEDDKTETTGWREGEYAALQKAVSSWKDAADGCGGDGREAPLDAGEYQRDYLVLARFAREGTMTLKGLAQTHAAIHLWEMEAYARLDRSAILTAAHYYWLTRAILCASDAMGMSCPFLWRYYAFTTTFMNAFTSSGHQRVPPGNEKRRQHRLLRLALGDLVRIESMADLRADREVVDGNGKPLPELLRAIEPILLAAVMPKWRKVFDIAAQFDRAFDQQEILEHPDSPGDSGVKQAMPFFTKMGFFEHPAGSRSLYRRASLDSV